MKFIFTMLFGISAMLATAQRSTLPAPEASFLAIIVSDIDKSIAWYSNHLGFEVQNRTELPERGFRQANLLSENVQFELLEINTAIFPEEILAERERGSRMGGFFKFGFRVSEFDRWLEHLRNGDVEFHGEVVIDTVSKKKMVIVKDPDGNRIQFFEE